MPDRVRDGASEHPEHEAAARRASADDQPSDGADVGDEVLDDQDVVAEVLPLDRVELPPHPLEVNVPVRVRDVALLPHLSELVDQLVPEEGLRTHLGVRLRKDDRVSLGDLDVAEVRDGLGVRQALDDVVVRGARHDRLRPGVELVDRAVVLVGGELQPGGVVHPPLQSYGEHHVLSLVVGCPREVRVGGQNDGELQRGGDSDQVVVGPVEIVKPGLRDDLDEVVLDDLLHPKAVHVGCLHPLVDQ